MLIPQSDAGTIPRYALPGVVVTKSVHMVNPLDMMVRDFSREKNVPQRDIFAAALLEFFRKYGNIINVLWHNYFNVLYGQ